MATVRIACELPDYDDCWIEIKGLWTRGEAKRMVAAETDTDLLDLIIGKIVACRLRLVDGTEVETPAGLTEDRIDNLDIELYGWLLGAIFAHVGQRRTLGELNGRRSYHSSERLAAQKSTPA